MKNHITAFVALFIGVTSTIACGPGTQSGGGSSMSPEREKWTRQRLHHLHAQHAKQEAQLEKIQMRRRTESFDPDPMSGDPIHQLERSLRYTDADRTHDEIRRQREINTIEFLAIKKERGELSPAGEKKLKRLIQDVRSR